MLDREVRKGHRMKLTDLKPGDRIRTTRNWECLPEGTVRVVRKDDFGLYVKCREGEHYLDGQQGEVADDPLELAGLVSI